MTNLLIYITYLIIGYTGMIYALSSCHDDYFVQSDDDIEKIIREIQSDDSDF